MADSTPGHGGFDVVVVADDLQWGEGPSWWPAVDGVVFADIPANRILHWSERTGVRVLAQPSNHANGTAVNAANRLVCCEHAGRRVVERTADGSMRVLVEGFDGRRFNSPNDVTVAPDGAVWFTDPPYGILQGHCGPDARVEQECAGVYRYDPRTNDVARMIEFETRIDEAFARIDEGELSSEDYENFYRRLGHYRGLSEAAVEFARVAETFDWQRWRETRF